MKCPERGSNRDLGSPIALVILKPLSREKPCCKVTIQRVMRIRAILLTTVAVLLFCLAASELPELTRLVDDTSNDFALANSQEARGTVIQNQGSRIACNKVIATVTMPCYKASALPSVSSVPSPSTHNLLHSLCIQRT